MKKQRQKSKLPPKASSPQHGTNRPVTRPQASADWVARAHALHRAGNLNDAESICQALLASDPKRVEALLLLGIIHAQRGNLEEGIRLMEKAIAVNPRHAQAYYNRGLALQMLGRYEDALASYKKVITFNPHYVEAYNNQGLALFELKQYSNALASYDKAIAINSDYAEAHNNRGLALYLLKRYNDALASYDKAITINPNYDKIYHNRGLVLPKLGQYNDALADFDKAIAINPHYAEAYWNKGLLLLLLGKFEEGWKLYEWRWKKKDRNEDRKFGKPLWLGKDSLKNKTILLHSEQGFGDAIQWCRYVPMVEALGAKVVLEVPASMVGLITTLRGSFHPVARGSTLPEFEFYCPLESLPLAFNTTGNTIPANIPYLSADPDKRKAWQNRLGEKARPRIGLAWSGSAQHKNDSNRSIALSQLSPLLQCNFDFHSLQKEVRPEDEAILKNSNPIMVHADHLKDFADTAALISEMDLIISVDTSVAHLAGALGKPVWMLLHFIPDFRWMMERGDSPWYPTARLFRQSRIDDWADVIEMVKTQLCGNSQFVTSLLKCRS